MPKITRREFMRYCTIVGGTIGLSGTGLLKLDKLLASESGAPVVWLQGACCTGCSTSLLNSIYYATIDDLLLNTLDLEYHPTVMAAAGDLAVSAAEAAYAAKNYVLVVEGAIPSNPNADYCHIWEGMTMFHAVKQFAQNAAYILAVGTCAAFGGIPGGTPNPSNAKGVESVLGSAQRSKLINIPGCPSHPDWIVGTIANLLASGKLPKLDSHRRPRQYFGKIVHSECLNKVRDKASILSEAGCLKELGCRGQFTGSDCPKRLWNSAAMGQYGVNWCVAARNPCQGCTEPDFPDGQSPFYEMEKRKAFIE
jgi:hydrogenase small subunit